MRVASGVLGAFYGSGVWDASHVYVTPDVPGFFASLHVSGVRGV